MSVARTPYSPTPPDDPLETEAEARLDRGLRMAFGGPQEPLTPGATTPPPPPGAPRQGGSAPLRLGRFDLIETIGRGGLGTVWRAVDPVLGREVAVKVLHAHHRGRADLVRRALAEAKVTGRLQHPGIVPVHEIGEGP